MLKTWTNQAIFGEKSRQKISNSCKREWDKRKQCVSR